MSEQRQTDDLATAKLTRRRFLGRTIGLIAGFSVLGLLLSACGKKNRPQLPEGQSDSYPRQYPNPEDL